MKRFLPLIIILLSFSVMAQQRGQNRERIKALKIAFITEKLDLTEQEAQKFWPVYNAFDEKQSKIKHEEMRELKMKARQNFADMTDAEATEVLDKIVSSDNKLHKLKQDFIKDLKPILPAKKIILLKTAEDEFNRRMLDEFKKRRQGKY